SAILHHSFRSRRRGAGSEGLSRGRPRGPGIAKLLFGPRLRKNRSARARRVGTEFPDRGAGSVPPRRAGLFALPLVYASMNTRGADRMAGLEAIWPTSTAPIRHGAVWLEDRKLMEKIPMTDA